MPKQSIAMRKKTVRSAVQASHCCALPPSPCGFAVVSMQINETFLYTTVALPTAAETERTCMTWWSPQPRQGRINESGYFHISQTKTAAPEGFSRVNAGQPCLTLPLGRCLYATATTQSDQNHAVRTLTWYICAAVPDGNSDVLRTHD
jgi:hypothetical protein